MATPNLPVLAAATASNRAKVFFRSPSASFSNLSNSDIGYGISASPNLATSLAFLYFLLPTLKHPNWIVSLLLFECHQWQTLRFLFIFVVRLPYNPHTIIATMIPIFRHLLLNATLYNGVLLVSSGSDRDSSCSVFKSFCSSLARRSPLSRKSI